jgi:hypothetical protein
MLGIIQYFPRDRKTGGKGIESGWLRVAVVSSGLVIVWALYGAYGPALPLIAGS